MKDGEMEENSTTEARVMTEPHWITRIKDNLRLEKQTCNHC